MAGQPIRAYRQYRGIIGRCAACGDHWEGAVKGWRIEIHVQTLILCQACGEALKASLNTQDQEGL